MAKITNVRRVFLRGESSQALDIDTDFGKSSLGEDRNTIVKYLEDKYNRGKDIHVALVGTRTTYSIKSALRDVGRTFEIPPSEIFAVTKEIDESISLDENLKKSKSLKTFIEKYLEPFKIASQITGVTSNFGVHAGGVVISDIHYPLNKTLPLHKSNSDTPSTILDKDEIQDLVGLIKYDLLGVNALTQITYTKSLLGDKDIYSDYTESSEPFKMCKSGHHKNIFQFESPLGKRTFKECKMESIMDLSNASGMIRQMGTAEGRLMYDKYKENSMSDESVWKQSLRSEVSEKTFDVVLPILSKTYGVLIYQEQLSEMIQKLSNEKFSFGEGDSVRKTLSKFVGKHGLVPSLQGKRSQLKEWHKDMFDLLNKYVIPFLDEDDLNIEGVVDFINFNLDSKDHLPIPQKGIINWFIIGSTYLFSIIHSVAYSVISFNQMHQKYYHPVQFWIGALSTGSKDDVNNYVTSAQSESGIKFLGPHINKSSFSFTEEGEKVVRFGLGFIAGMDKAAEEIINERKNGDFKSFQDFISRMKGKRSVNKKTIENLIFSGAFYEDQESIYNSCNGDPLAWDDKSKRIREANVLGVVLSNAVKVDTEGCSSISELHDGISSLCGFIVLKNTLKKTKKGKDYFLLSVKCVISEEKTNVFVWDSSVSLKEGEYYKCKLKKQNDFVSLSY